MKVRTRTLVVSLCLFLLACGTVAAAKGRRPVTHRRILGAVATTKQIVTTESAATRKEIDTQAEQVRERVALAIQTATDPLKQQLTDARNDNSSLRRYAITTTALLVGMVLLQVLVLILVQRRTKRLSAGTGTQSEIPAPVIVEPQPKVQEPPQVLPETLRQFPTPDGRFTSFARVDDTDKIVGYFTEGEVQHYAVLHPTGDNRFPGITAPFVEIFAPGGVIDEKYRLYSWVAGPNDWKRMSTYDAYRLRKIAATAA